MPMCPNPYQEWELETIRRCYPAGGPQAVIDAGVNRTPFSIRTKANLIGVLLSKEARSAMRRESAIKTQNLPGLQEEKPTPPEYLSVSDIFQVGARVAQREYA